MRRIIASLIVTACAPLIIIAVVTAEIARTRRREFAPRWLRDYRAVGRQR